MKVNDKMTIADIDRYLRKKNRSLNVEVLNAIELLKKEAVSNRNEQLANILWCYKQVFLIQRSYLQAYKSLEEASHASDALIDKTDSDKSKKYELAWNELDHCDIESGFLENVFCVPSAQIDDFNITFILADLKKLQPLFPYKIFTSREGIIKSEECSICHKPVSVRNPCGHEPGKLYMGEICSRKVTDCQIVNVSIVTHPFDKYAILKVEGQQFDFSLLDFVIPHILPYCEWSYRVEEQLKDEFKNVGKNDICPCGTGMKFKYCIKKNHDRHYKNHYVISSPY